LRISLSQEELAFLIGVDRSYMGKVERGVANLTVFRLFVIAHHLKVTPRELLQ
jgi:transcriptional regulator with XRE-family HTH domain